MTDNEYYKTRKAAADALIYWAKTGMRQFTMRDAVNNYLEACGANRPSIGGEETILAHRKIAANRLAIDCIYALSKEELSKVDRELENIVGDLPKQGYGMRRWRRPLHCRTGDSQDDAGVEYQFPLKAVRCLFTDKRSLRA